MIMMIYLGKDHLQFYYILNRDLEIWLSIPNIEIRRCSLLVEYDLVDKLEPDIQR